MHKGQTYRRGQYDLHELDKMAYLLVAESEVPEVHNFVQEFSGDQFVEKVAKKLNMAKDVKNLYQKANNVSKASDNLGFLRSNPGAAGALLGAGLGAATSKDDRLGGAVMGAGIGGMGGAFAGPKLLAQKGNTSGGLSKRKFNKRVEELVEKRLAKQEGKLDKKTKQKVKEDVKEKVKEKVKNQSENQSQNKVQTQKVNKNKNQVQDTPQTPVQQQMQQAKEEAQVDPRLNKQPKNKAQATVQQQAQTPVNVGSNFDPFSNTNPSGLSNTDYGNLLNQYSNTRVGSTKVPNVAPASVSNTEAFATTSVVNPKPKTNVVQTPVSRPMTQTPVSRTQTQTPVSRPMTQTPPVPPYQLNTTASTDMINMLNSSNAAQNPVSRQATQNLVSRQATQNPLSGQVTDVDRNSMSELLKDLRARNPNLAS
jgi:hypothetical protein